ncbi:MAG: hypothetical protein LBJ18_03640 [Rickettsiales bacterium]|jgi:hypothetical protein|nr:hypothetical protein [Rickettsiales bacterium]
MSYNEIELKRIQKSRDIPAFFFVKPLYNSAKSLSAGRPIYDPVIMLQVDTGGTATVEIKEFAATPELKKLYSDAWKFFETYQAPQVRTGINDLEIEELAEQHPEIYREYIKNCKTATGISGTLIEELNIIPISVVQELKSIGVFYIEQIWDETVPTEIITREILDAAKRYKKLSEHNFDLNQLADTIDQLCDKLENK